MKRGIVDAQSRIIEHLRDKDSLLVMDNFENVLDGATVVQELLSAPPHLQILTLSRAKLNLMRETVFNIEDLTVSDRSPEKNSAIQLFNLSAKRIRPNFELNAIFLNKIEIVMQISQEMM